LQQHAVSGGAVGCKGDSGIVLNAMAWAVSHSQAELERAKQ